MSASQYKDTRKMITHVTKSETLSLLFPWTTEEITDEQFCKLCFIMDVVTRSLQEPVTSCYRPGATIKDSNYYSILASELIHLPGDIPRNRKGQIQLDLKTKGLDAHIKLFGVYNDTSINRCPCCGCINGVKYKCSRCKAMRYCSKTCQQVHWKVHKRACIHFEDEKMRIIACVLRDEDKWKEEKEEMEKSNE